MLKEEGGIAEQLDEFFAIVFTDVDTWQNSGPELTLSREESETLGPIYMQVTFRAEEHSIV